MPFFLSEREGGSNINLSVCEWVAFTQQKERQMEEDEDDSTKDALQDEESIQDADDGARDNNQDNDDARGERSQPADDIYFESVDSEGFKETVRQGRGGGGET